MTKKKRSQNEVPGEDAFSELAEFVACAQAQVTEEVLAFTQDWARFNANLWGDSVRVLTRGAANVADVWSSGSAGPPAAEYTVEAELFHTPAELRVENFVRRTDTPGNVGVCLSGGGSRAMIAAMGQLRGLHELGWLSRVKALSTVSGGSWAAVPFTYLPDSISDENFLNAHVDDPGELSLTGWSPKDRAGVLDYLPPDNLGHVAAHTRMSSVALTVAALDLFVEQGVPSHRIWAYLVGSNVLNPFGLAEFDRRHLPTSFFAYDKKMAREILAANPHLPETCHVYRQPKAPGDIIRPFHICNTSMFIEPKPGSSIPRSGGKLLAPVQSTAFFTGILASNLGTDAAGRSVGGGGVASYAFNSRVEKLLGADKVAAAQSHAFALADITGMSSAFFASTLAEALSGLSGLDPQYSYWPTANAKRGAGSQNLFADGGGIEDNGVASILAYNDIDNLIVFVNSTELEQDPFGNVKIDEWLPSLFGFAPYQAGLTESTTGYFRYVDLARPSGLLGDEGALFYQHNQVFPSDAFTPLLQKIWANSGSGTNEHPAVCLQSDLEVLPNHWFNVKGGRKVNVLWVILNPVESWSRQLRPEVREQLSSDFPNYNILQTHLSPFRVNLLAHLTAWTICQQASVLTEMFSDKHGPQAGPA